METPISSSREQSRRVKTALSAIQAYNDWSLTDILGIRSPTCIQEILPKSLGRPLMDNATYSAYFSAMMPYFRNFTVKVNDIIEDARANKVAVWAESTADTDIGPYKNEYMLVFYLDERGEKVERMLEFVDSANSVEFFPKLRKYAEGLKGK